jgi:GDP-4-dehydro-6-deoxy-D-mannose reductase
LRSLITGAGGFAGSHLADYLLAQPDADTEVWGGDRIGQPRPYHPPGLKLLGVDLRDPAATRQLIEHVRPNRVYHLAAQAFVGASWANPWETLETNLRSQVNVLEAIRDMCPDARVLVLGSNEEYGHVAAEDLPVPETHPLRPASPYGVSKVGQDLLGLQYHLSHGLHIVRVRPFNHIGPRQDRKFVAPAFAAQIAAIEAGRQPPVMRVGHLGARRDFTDVRDMVRAYTLALEQGEPGEVYNIGSGRSRGIQELLDALLSFSSAAILVEVDPARLRPSDVPNVVCDATKFRTRTGWAPRLPFEQSLKDLLDYERALAGV